jgi:predicted metalloprotease with PDZ domain
MLLTLIVLLFGGARGAADDGEKEEPKKARSDAPKEEARPLREPTLAELLQLMRMRNAAELKEIMDKMAMMRKSREDMEKAFQDLRKALQGNDDAIRRAMEKFGQPLPPQYPVTGFPGMLGAMLDPRLGGFIRRPTATETDQLGLPRGKGLVLLQVRPGAAADQAGLKPNDILLELNGKPVSSAPYKWAEMIAPLKPDEAAEVVVLRKGKRQTIKGLKLPAAQEGAPPKEAPLEKKAEPTKEKFGARLTPRPYRGVQARARISPNSRGSFSQAAPPLME